MAFTLTQFGRVSPSRAIDKPAVAETWLPIPGFEGIYDVSDRGNVRNATTGRVLKPYAASGGYLRVNLRIDGGGKHLRVHRLVASAFIRLPHPREQVNHIDLDKRNNAIENLEWVSGKENVRHFKDAMKRLGKVGPAPRLLSYEIAQNIRRDYRDTDTTYKKLADKHGVSTSCIWHILAERSYVPIRREGL